MKHERWSLSKKTERMNSIFGPITVGISSVLVALSVLVGLPVVTNADGPNTADVVVQFPDGNDVIVRRFHFTEPVSGVKALQLAGLDVVSNGDTVCAIEDVGCPATDCFCPDNWWFHYYWDGNVWQEYPWPPPLISTTGAVEGWRWYPSWPAEPPPPAPRLVAVSEALEWLSAQQVITDGGYSGMSASVDMMFALGANKLPASTWIREGGTASLNSYILRNGAGYANTSAGQAGKLAVAIAAAGDSWPVGAMKPLDYYSPTIGAYSPNAIFQAWAILGTLAMSETVPPEAIQSLKDMAQPQGGWEWSPGWGIDTNTTAVAIQALAAAGEPITSSAIVSGLNYLKSVQNADGGFPYSTAYGSQSDTNSTAYVIQALQAVVQPPPLGTGSFGSFVVTNSTPISYLLSMQLSDGSFEWQTGMGSDQFATRQAIPALLGKPFPLNIREISEGANVYLPLVLRH